MTDTLPEMWWPSPEALEDLSVEDAEHGFDLSAPDGTECGEWLTFWNQDEAHHKIFEEEFTAVLRNYANQILEKHGENEILVDRGTEDRIQTQDECPRTQSEHESGSDPE
jgi:hypothetical protein